jgi:hypothetical protein
VSRRWRAIRFQYRSQRKFITSRIGIIRLLREPFTPAPILLINRKVRMNSLENPDPQFLEVGRLFNQCAHFASPFCNTSRKFPSDKAARKRGPMRMRDSACQVFINTMLMPPRAFASSV